MLGYERGISYLYYMRERVTLTPLNKNKSESSRVYKVSFANGDTHYGRIVLSKNYSARTYLADMAGRLVHNSNNPIRVNMTTEVERRVAMELETTKCEIVFEGSTEEAVRVKDTLVIEDLKSLNTRHGVVMGEQRDEFKIPIKYSKSVKNAAGNIINYISSNYANLNKLGKYLDERSRYPMDKSFVQILVPISRY